MKHIVYRTENILNGKFYYGVHDGSNDDYLGSGVLLKKAIEKNGRENFVRRTIKEFDSVGEAYDFEELIVDRDFTERDDCYNIAEGGKGGYTGKHTEETKAKLSEHWTQYWKENIPWSTGKKKSEETKQKISESKKGVPSKKKGIKMSDESRKKMSESAKRRHAKNKAL